MGATQSQRFQLVGGDSDAKEFFWCPVDPGTPLPTAQPSLVTYNGRERPQDAQASSVKSALGSSALTFPIQDLEGESSHLSVPTPCPSASHLSSSSRFAKYYSDPTGAEHRTLIKAYGIRFDIIVFGKVAWPPPPLGALAETQASGLARKGALSPPFICSCPLSRLFLFLLSFAGWEI